MTIEGLAGQAVAQAVAVGERFDPAALRNHAHYIGAALESAEAARGFAQQLHTSLLALALLAEER
jgi:hypothetical protein